jgi:HAD superfamily hydrolase (TIGR01509 family)
MSGGLIVHALAREAGRGISSEEAERLQKLHGEEYSKRVGQTRLLPGARELLDALDKGHVQWAIASSGKREKQQHAFDMLKIGEGVPLVTRDDVQHAKPAPDLFEVAAEKLGADLKDCMVVGDSIWDLLAARRARALGIGLLSGGYGESELTQAGAYRVYRDPADMLVHLDEMGIQVKA